MRAVGVVEYIRSRFGGICWRALGVVGLMRARSTCRRVHSGASSSSFLVNIAAPLVSSGSFGFVGFIQARPVCRRVLSASLGAPCGSSGSLGFRSKFKVHVIQTRLGLDKKRSYIMIHESLKHI